MGANGQVTITAKVDSARAEEALKSLGAVATKVSVDIRNASGAQVQATNEASEAMRRHSQHVKQAEQSVKEYGAEIVRMTSHMMLMGAAMGVAMGAVQGVGNAFRFSVDQAADLQSSLNTLRIVAEKTGGSFAGSKQLIREFSDAVSAPASVAQATRVFTTMNMSMVEQRKLIGGIRDGLVAMGMDVNEQLPMMALAIKRQESVLLDNMGVTRTIEMMYKEYARTIGKTVDALSQQEKEQAVVNGTLRELSAYAGTAKESLNTYRGSVNNLQSAFRDLGTTVGNEVNPILTTMNNKLAEMIRQTNSLVQDKPRFGEQVGQRLGFAFSGNPAVARLLGQGGKLLGTLKSIQPETNEKYGPGFGEDFRAQAARAKAAAQKASEEASAQRAEAAKKEAAEAKKRADDQKQQAQDLQDALLTIGKTGKELELAQEQIYHRKQMEIAKGNHRNIELEAERHRRALAVIEGKHPSLVIEGSNSEAAALNRLHVGTVGGLSVSTFEGRNGLGRLGLGLGRNLGSGYQNALDSWSASRGQAIPAPVLERVEADLTVPVANAFEKGAQQGMERAIRSVMDGDFGSIGPGLASTIKDSLASAMTEAATMAFSQATLVTAAASAALFAMPFVITKWNQDQNRADGNTAMERQFQQHMASNLPSGSVTFDLSVPGMTRIDPNEQRQIELQLEAAKQQFEAAQMQREAAKQAAEQRKDLRVGITENTTQSERRLAVLNGTMTEAEAARLNAYDRADAGARNAAAAISKIYWGDDSTADFYLKKFRDGGADGLKGLMKDSDIEILAAAIKEADLEKTIADKEAERLGPGSTPDRPIYSSIVNFRDMMAFFAPGELFRAQGPGTRRDDGMKGRAVNTRAV